MRGATKDIVKVIRKNIQFWIDYWKVFFLNNYMSSAEVKRTVNPWTGIIANKTTSTIGLCNSVGRSQRNNNSSGILRLLGSMREKALIFKYWDMNAETTVDHIRGLLGDIEYGQPSTYWLPNRSRSSWERHQWCWERVSIEVIVAAEKFILHGQIKSILKIYIQKCGFITNLVRLLGDIEHYRLKVK